MVWNCHVWFRKRGFLKPTSLIMYQSNLNLQKKVTSDLLYYE